MTSGWQAGLTITLDPGGSPTSLTDDFVALPLFTDVGTEEINQAILVLDADDGKFITKSPIINQRDRIRIAHTDEFGDIYNHVFYVDKLIPRQSKRTGTKLELHLLGHERDVQDIQFMKPFFFEGAKQVSIDILDFYNQQIGTDQTVVTDHDTTNNELPSWTNNVYEFGLNEDSGFNRINQVVDKLGASADAGGVFDFFETRWDSDDLDEKLVHFKAFSSGSKPATPIDIVDTISINVGETEAGIEARKATIVASWGSLDDGSLLTGFSRYRGEKEAFQLHPQWVQDAPYLVDHRVVDEGIHYKCSQDRTVGPNQPPSIDTGSWFVITENSEFGNSITYSEFTRQKAALIQNSGSNHQNLGGSGSNEPFGESFWDANVVVWDDNPDTQTFRSWVHVRTNTEANINAFYLYNNSNPAGIPRGLRVLVDPIFGVIGTPFTQNGGKDNNDRDFNNGIVQYNNKGFTGSENYKNWDVLYEANSTEDTGLMVAVKDEGRVYAYDFDFIPTDRWVNIAATSFANDCFHPYDSVTNDGGILATSAGDTSFTANNLSAVKVQYNWSHIPFLPDIAADIQNYYKAGMWFNLEFPFPVNTYRSITEDVGDIYGGGEQGTTIKEPATLDTQNMHFTHSGLRGFLHGLDSADYGQISALEFFIKYRAKSISIGGIPIVIDPLPIGNFKFRVYFFDTSDNVVFQDFVIPHNGVWEAIKLPINGFQIYRGRRPIENSLQTIIPPKQLDPQNVFLWRNVKKMSIQYQEPYDEDGRYRPQFSQVNQTGIFQDLETTMHIDGLRFTKPLLAVTDPPTDIVIMKPPMEQPTISNFRQLLNDAKAELEKGRFIRKQYDLVTSGTYGVKFGESVDITNSELINDSDDGANTIRVVAKKLEYSITRPQNGSGGFLRTLQGVRRLNT